MAFTGSVATGRAVNLAAAKNLRPATMELGGKGPIIVFSDVDVDKAVEWVAVCHNPPRLVLASEAVDSITCPVCSWFMLFH